MEGYDARAKLVILTQAGLRMDVRDEQVQTRPISTIQAVDFLYAGDLDCTIRQLSLAQKDTSNGLRLFAAVQPAVIPMNSLMAHVQGSQNMVMATGQYAGRMVFSGYGAGGDPTAVAIVSDLYAIARTAGAPSEALPDVPEVPASVSGDFTVPHYLRFVVRDRPGILAEIAAVLAKYKVGIDAVLQKPGFPDTALSFVMTLEACDSAVLRKALRRNQPARLPRGAARCVTCRSTRIRSRRIEKRVMAARIEVTKAGEGSFPEFSVSERRVGNATHRRAEAQRLRAPDRRARIPPEALIRLSFEFLLEKRIQGIDPAFAVRLDGDLPLLSAIRARDIETAGRGTRVTLCPDGFASLRACSLNARCERRSKSLVAFLPYARRSTPHAKSRRRFRQS